MPINEIAAGITAIKETLKLAKSVKDIHDDVELNNTLIQIQEHVLGTQESFLAAQQQIDVIANEKRDLEREVLEAEQWSEKAANYQLIEVREGLLVYAFQPLDDSTDPPHWACPTCFTKKQIQILQRLMPSSPMVTCQCCGMNILPDKASSPRGVRVITGDNRRDDLRNL